MRRRMADFAEGVRSGAIRGATGKPFRAVLHIGIGGSDLGPRLVWEALKPLDPQIELRFAANVDGSEIAAALAGLDARSTLVIVVSKTFTTQETLANGEAARAWLHGGAGPTPATPHLAAVSAAPDKAEAFGVPAERVFAFWDWVGGRYSRLVGGGALLRHRPGLGRVREAARRRGATWTPTSAPRRWTATRRC